MLKTSFKTTLSLVSASVLMVFATMGAAYAAIDEAAAKALAKKNDCFKCHAVDKTKKGPSMKKISAKYKGKADGLEKGIKNITTTHTVKLEDGTEEEHKIIDTKDAAAIKNLVEWMLSQ